jgi:hypothetical protein
VVALTILFALFKIVRAKNYKILYQPLAIILPGIIALIISQALINSSKYNFGDEVGRLLFRFHNTKIINF